jgi:hypothetical protein
MVVCFAYFYLILRIMYSYRYVYVSLLFVCSFLYILCQLAFSGKPWLKFFPAFSSVVRQMPGYTSQKTGHGPHSSKLVNCVVLCIVCFVSFSVLFVCICVLYYCHRVSTQLQLNISYYMISYNIIPFLIIFTDVFKMRQNEFVLISHST